MEKETEQIERENEFEKELKFKTYLKMKKFDWKKTFKDAKFYNFIFYFIGYITHIRYFHMKKIYNNLDYNKKRIIWDKIIFPRSR